MSTEIATIPDPPPDIADELVNVEHLYAANVKMDLPNWYVLTMAQLDDQEERIKAQAKILRNAVETRRKALAWKFGAAVKAEIDKQLAAQKGPKKSITLAMGSAGYRMAKGKIIQHDRKALAEWCVEHCVEALDYKVARTTPIVEHIQATGEIPPGVEWIPPGDVFFPRVNQAALPSAEDNDDE